ncbi:TraR/DksA C4-type zinc finger protein [Thiotrichales bacterium 19S9-12]|nr:TraR/DksA C4-type zinc finger protein [Thiotrichales bacterium 19S9-11]MCF6810772.1 TraR/DksA C4-type zinc finger protein [Thiotrichales bacterium 19S9-12]
MLTEAKLLAMTEDDYMNDEQLGFFRHLLEENKNELVLSIEEAKKNLSEAEHNIDLNDVATQQEMQQLYLRTVERQGKLLRKVESAIKRTESGDYGYCEVTGEPIGLRRLLARPTATLSIQAKEIQEHHEKTEGTS